MRQLILLRHAKAGPHQDDDFARALADRGRDDAPKVGQALKDANAKPQVALVSEARRCTETWALVAPFLGKVELRTDMALYNAAAETLMEEAEMAGVDHVLVCAHNPGIHELASRLAHRNTDMDRRVRAKFAPGSAAVFERADKDSAWRLTAFIAPKELGE